VYFLTGRSPSSQARRFVLRPGALAVAPTDADAEFDELRHYLCATGVDGSARIVVGNGDHVATIAQLLAEVSTVAANTTWVTPRPPRFLPDDVDGRVLFDVASARSAALAAGRGDQGGVAALGDIVMIPTVKDARDRGVLTARPLFRSLTVGGVAWADGTEESADAIIWCTGFRPALNHLTPLHLPRTSGHLDMQGTRAAGEPRLHLLGYGDWTGQASATLIGVGRTARAAVHDLTESLAATVG